MLAAGRVLVVRDVDLLAVGELHPGPHHAALLHTLPQQPGQSEVSLRSRDLVSTNHSSPGHPLLHVGVGQLGGVAVDMEQHSARAPVISPHVLDS